MHTLQELNNITDEKVTYYTEHREYSFVDCIVAIGIFFLSFGPGEILIALFSFGPGELETALITHASNPGYISTTSMLLAALFLLWYYHHKAKLRINIWFTLIKLATDAGRLMTTKTFLAPLTRWMLFIASGFINAKQLDASLVIYLQEFSRYPFMVAVFSFFLTPVYEELAFRGIIYRLRFSSAKSWRRNPTDLWLAHCLTGVL